MAGFGFKGHTVTFNSIVLTHLTSIAVQVQGSNTTQEVADSAAALSLAGTPIESVVVAGVVPTSGAATLLNGLAFGETGALVIVFKDGLGGSTVVTWTAVDSASESQGAGVTASAGAFTNYSLSISTNGGAWT